MRRLKILLLTVVSVMATAGAYAQLMIGRVLTPEEIQDGMQVVFEARSGTSSAGHYLVPWDWAKRSNSDRNPCQTINSILEVPDSIVWILEKSQTPNPVTGWDQYYIKSKATGKYLNFVWNENGTICIDANANTWVNDTASAKAFCIVSNESEDTKTYNGVNYGSVKYSSATSDWEPSTYAVTYIFAPKGSNTSNRGNGYGRVFLANEFDVSHYNITFYSQYEDTNVWDIRRLTDRGTDPEAALNDLLDNYKASVESDYAYGTDPGFVKSKDLYNSFWTSYTEAVNATAETHTAAEWKTYFDNLYNSKTAVDNEDNLVPIKDGGYYYVKTANSAFYQADNGDYAWNIYDQNHAGWSKLDSLDNQFIWQYKEWKDTTKNEDGTMADTRIYYSVQNMATKQYLSKGDKHGDGEWIGLTSTFQYPQFARHLNHAGQYNLGSKYDFYDVYPPRPFHQNGHNSGAGTSGTLCLYSGDANTPSAWFLREVPAEVVANMGARADFDNMRTLALKYYNVTDGATVGDKLGMPHSQATIDNVTNAYAAVYALYTQAYSATTDYKTPAANLEAAVKAYKAEVNTVPDGYYRFKGNYRVYANNYNDIYVNVYNDSTPGWAHLENTTDYIWKVTNLPDGNFTIQNVKTGKYLNKAAAPQNGSIVSLTDQPETEQCLSIIKPNGTWAIYNTEDSTFSFDPNGHDTGLNDEGRIHIWSPRDATGGTSWSLIPVTEDEVNSLKAAEADNELAVSLKKKFQEARRAYNAKTNYTLGEKILTDASQLYGNNFSTSEGTNIGNLIDGDKNTTWCSTWEDGKEQNPTEPHYLRAYDEAGFPDTVQVNYVQRQNGTWHRVPTSLRIEVSDDAVTWTNVPTAQLRLADFGGKSTLESVHADSLHYIVSGIGGHKYVRFIAQCAYRGADGVYIGPNAHFVFEYAEFNLYPVTGVSPDSYSQTGLHKVSSDALFSAIQEAYPLVKEGKGTQEVLDKLTTALDEFNSMESTDSLIAMTKYNLENLTAGDRIGEFPDDALNTYVQTVQPMIQALDAGQASQATVEQVQQAKAAVINAYNTLYDQMNKPEENKWYMIVTNDPSKADFTLSAGGPNTHANGIGYSYVLVWQQTSVASTSTGASWTFSKDTTDNGRRYILQNARTGGYFGPYTGSGDSKYDYTTILWSTPRSFTVVPFGDGQIGLQTKEGYYVKYDGSVIPKYVNTYDYNFKDSGFSWSLEAVDDQHSDEYDEHTSESKEGYVVARAYPFDLDGTPYSTLTNEHLAGYEIVGKESADDKDSLVTAIKLKAIPTDEVVKAGTPVIYIMSGSVSADSKTDDFHAVPVLNTPLNAKVDTVNGLISVPATWNAPVSTWATFDVDSLTAINQGVQVLRRFAVVDVQLIKNTLAEGEEPDAIVYVKGAGIVNGIKKLEVVDVKQFVNVYTTDGILLRKHVDAANATVGLPKGIYIVGNKKVQVK